MNISKFLQHISRSTSLCVALLVFTLQGNAQTFDPTGLEKQFRKVFPQSYNATVRLLVISDTVSGRVAGIATGVVIDSLGHIITAGHNTEPGRNFRIVFPDGSEAKARGLGKIDALDAGLIKITEKGSWPYAPLGRSAALKENQPCLCLGYPGTLRGSKPALRFGRIINLGSERMRFLQTSCLMEPGDSGGPVFDLEGNVIGIHSMIHMGLDENFEVPVDVYLQYWNSLTQKISHRQAPENGVLPLPSVSGRLPVYRELANMETTFAKVEKKLESSSILVQSTEGDSTWQALGTLIAPEGMSSRNRSQGKSYLVSKSSIVGEKPFVIVNGLKKMATVLKRDEDRDLALLEVSAKLKGKNVSLEQGAIDSLKFDMIGRFLISPHPLHHGRVSVLGSTTFAISGFSRTGFLGAAYYEKDDKFFVGMVQPGSPAQSHLKVGDRILTVNGLEIKALSDFERFLLPLKAGEQIVITGARNDSLFTIKPTLIKMPENPRHTSERFEGGKSELRDGFEKVFVHDARLKPSECGGPVFDINGNFYGINIARFSRTSSLVMPTSEIKAFLK